jgi:Ca2+/Na+ antiporter
VPDEQIGIRFLLTISMLTPQVMQLLVPILFVVLLLLVPAYLIVVFVRYHHKKKEKKEREPVARKNGE